MRSKKIDFKLKSRNGQTYNFADIQVKNLNIQDPEQVELLIDKIRAFRETAILLSSQNRTFSNDSIGDLESC